MSRRPRLYLAGPEVFLPDALAMGRAKQDCAPGTASTASFRWMRRSISPGLPKRDQARRISAANEAAMRSCAG